MKLKTRVSLAAVGVAVVSAFAVAGVVLAVSYSSGVKQIQHELDQAISVVEESTEDALTTAQLAVRGRELTLAYVESDGSVTVLQDSAGNLGDTNLETKTLALTDGEKLIFAASTKEVLDSTVSSLLLTILVATMIALLGIFTSWLLLRKDIRNVRLLTVNAQNMGTGNLQELPPVQGSTELVELSKSLSQLVRLLQSSNKQMQEFLGDASHELRTPLTVIRGYLEILDGDKTISSEQSRKAIERARSESLRMQSIISDILLLAELGEQRHPVVSEIFLANLLEPLIQDLRAQNPERHVELSLNQHAKFQGDAELIERFFQNAFSNIKRYTPADARVVIHIIQSPVGIDIHIDDSGPGIPSLSDGGQITIFKRFDDSRSRGTGGSGLGLSIMAKIIEKHGGQLKISRSSLGGLQVSAFLPV